MAIRRETRNVLWGLAGLLTLAAILLAVFFLVILPSGSSPTPQQTQAAPPLEKTSAAPVPSTPVPTTTVTHPPPPTAAPPLPRGQATPVLIPDGANPFGYTAGDMRFDYNAPGYTVEVPTATVAQHWGFTYNFHCDVSADDTWRLAYSNRGSFAVKLDGHYVLKGSAYNGSGKINVWSNTGSGVHQLVISGPCAYELDYYNFPN